MDGDKWLITFTDQHCAIIAVNLQSRVDAVSPEAISSFLSSYCTVGLRTSCLLLEGVITSRTRRSAANFSGSHPQGQWQAWKQEASGSWLGQALLRVLLFHKFALYLWIKETNEYVETLGKKSFKSSPFPLNFASSYVFQAKEQRGHTQQ